MLPRCGGGGRPLHAQLAPAKFIEGETVLLIELLALLEAFIGPAFTSRLVGDIWPQTISATISKPRTRSAAQ
jgi:hypothetical protein